jgi:hypothetical protein
MSWTHDDAVKVVRMYPKGTKPDGEIIWGFLKRPSYSLKIRNQFTELTLKFSLRSENWTVQHPPRMKHPVLLVGKGKNRKEVPDVLAAKVLKPGIKETYKFTVDFARRLEQMCGKVYAAVILKKFLDAIAEG